MSLTSIIRSKQATAFLGDMIRNPGLRPAPATRVPPVANPSRMGMAVDYAVRFGLAARYGAQMGSTVAQHVVFWVDQGEYGQELLPRLPELEARCADAVAAGRRVPFDADAARACFVLTGIELVHRSQRTVDAFRDPTSEEVDELLRLVDLVPWDAFAPKDRLLLNPSFHAGSNAVGGADADVVVDDGLIDIKTVKQQALRMADVRQLVGYAVLANEFGMSGDDRPRTISRVGLYFARAGVLHWMALSDCIAPDDEAEVLSFLLRAERAGGRHR